MKTEVRKSQTKMLLVPWVKLQRPRVRGCSLYQEETRDFRSDCPGSLSSPDAVEQTELGISTAEFSRADGTAPGYLAPKLQDRYCSSVCLEWDSDSIGPVAGIPGPPEVTACQLP